MNFCKIVYIYLGISFLAVSNVSAGFQAFANFDEWDQAVNGEFTTLDFVFEENQFLNDQYADQGVHFTDGDDVAYHSDNLFPNDSWGVTGGPSGIGSITIEFDSPQQAIAVNFVAPFEIEVFSEDTLLETVTTGGGGEDPFAGFLFSQTFDKVVLVDDLGGVVDIDDVHFGSTVPAPGALALLGMSGLIMRNRRRM